MLNRIFDYVDIKIIFLIAGAIVFWLVLRLILRLVKDRLFTSSKLGEKGRLELHATIKKVINIIILLFVYQFLPDMFKHEGKLLIILLKICAIAIVAYGISIINGLINTVYHIVSRKDKYRQRPIKGFMQILQMAVYFIGAIIMIAAAINKSPMGLLTGLGAFAAVLSFIFKDTILGFVAGIQLSYNDMLRPGDWIIVSGSLANGVVIDINLISIKVQNFDNTIVTVPTYSLINTSFQNWRGMDESAGRRITVNLNIDARSVCFCTPQQIEEFRKYIQMPLGDKEKEQITNLELYRMYLLKMILKNPQINKELTLMVRYLQPGPEGIPIQMYCFSKNKNWVTYEGIQASILEQAVASAQLFGIDIFQMAYTPCK